MSWKKWLVVVLLLAWLDCEPTGILKVFFFFKHRLILVSDVSQR